MKNFFMLITIAMSLFAVDASIDIEKSTTNLVKLAVESYSDATIGQSEKNMIDSMALQDIKVTDHMQTVSTAGKDSFDAAFDPVNMVQKNARILIRYKSYKSGKNLNIDAKVYDVSGAVLASKKYSVPTFAEYPFAVHKMAVDLNNLLKAPPVDWMQKFVVLAKNTGIKKSDIIVSDYTLTYQKTIVSGGYNIFPIWGTAAQDVIYYTTIHEDKPALYRYELYSGKKTKIISSNGMLVCSDVSKDGSKLLLTMAPHGLPDVFLYDLKTKNTTNVSNFAGIDVNGNFLDNDTKVAFVSDRLGYPTIFAKKLDSLYTEQLVLSGKNSSFSAKENFLVYSARDSGDNGVMQNIFHLDLASRNTTKLTNSGWNTMPKVSQNGDAIMFIKNDRGRTYLGVIRLNSLSVFLFPMNLGKIKSFNW